MMMMMIFCKLDSPFLSFSAVGCGMQRKWSEEEKVHPHPPNPMKLIQRACQFILYTN